MSAEEITLWVGIASLAVAVLTFVAAWSRARRALLAERPVLICHERHGRRFTDRGGIGSVAEVENVSARYAINIRFGVELNGVRFPWRHEDKDEDGSRWNVLAPGAMTGELPIRIPDEFAWSGGGDPDPGRVYWCVYESVAGEVWETRNPYERTDRFTYKRVRSRHWKLKRSRQRRQRALENGRDNLRRAIAEMAAELGDGEETGR